MWKRRRQLFTPKAVIWDIENGKNDLQEYDEDLHGDNEDWDDCEENYQWLSQKWMEGYELDDDEVDDEIEEASKELWSASDNDILACPKCTRKLKVPFDKRPAKARCPACETIFEARSE